MKKNIFLITLVLVFFNINFCFSENLSKIIIIKGKVLDEETGEGVAYANIGVVDTYIGNASNFDGDFEVKIPRKYKDKILQVSAVGYKTFYKKISEIDEKNFFTVKLFPKSYKIESVEIVSKSKVYMKMLKTAIKKLNENYLQTAFNYDIYYKEEKKINDKIDRVRQAAVKLYDANGYTRGNSYRVFKERSYKFLQVKKNFDSKNSLISGTTKLDDLLEMDIVRIRANVLDSNHLRNYDFKLFEKTTYEDDTIWVIDYNLKEPSLNRTGDYYATEYKGKIYINQKDFAVVKNETFAKSSNYSKLGRSFYVNEKRQTWKPISIEYDFTVIYKKHKKNYYLSYVNYNRHHIFENKKNSKKKTENLQTEMIINKITTTNVQVIQKRSYYENIKYNKKFWENYNYLLDKKN